MDDERRFELPEGLAPEDERAVITALERYFVQESPHPNPWVLAGRMDATGFGAIQGRRYMDEAWGSPQRHAFIRPGVPPYQGRGDVG
jgi:hypothetical protein